MVKISLHASRTKVLLFFLQVAFCLKMTVSMRAELYLKKCHVFQLLSFSGVVTGNERSGNWFTLEDQLGPSLLNMSSKQQPQDD